MNRLEPEGFEGQNLGHDGASSHNLDGSSAKDKLRFADLSREDFMRLWLESQMRVGKLEGELLEKDSSAATFVTETVVEVGRLRRDNADWGAYAGHQQGIINDQAEIIVEKNEALANQGVIIANQAEVITAKDKTIEGMSMQNKQLEGELRGLRAWRVRRIAEREASIPYVVSRGAERVAGLVGKVLLYCLDAYEQSVNQPSPASLGGVPSRNPNSPV